MLSTEEKTILEAAAARGDAYNNAVGDLVDAFPTRDFTSEETDEAERIFDAAVLRAQEARAGGFVIRYTTAPASYDGFGTRDEGAVARFKEGGKEMRRVRIDPKHLDWQESRYWSGFHRPRDEKDFEEMVQLGLVVRS